MINIKVSDIEINIYISPITRNMLLLTFLFVNMTLCGLSLIYIYGNKDALSDLFVNFINYLFDVILQVKENLVLSDNF